jgi:hypothetical protein
LLFFNTIAGFIGAFAPPELEFKHSVEVGVGLLHWQPFASSHLTNPLLWNGSNGTGASLHSRNMLKDNDILLE